VVVIDGVRPIATAVGERLQRKSAMSAFSTAAPFRNVRIILAQRFVLDHLKLRVHSSQFALIGRKKRLVRECPASLVVRMTYSNVFWIHVGQINVPNVDFPIRQNGGV
jgi:hypothetical protein